MDVQIIAQVRVKVWYPGREGLKKSSFSEAFGSMMGHEEILTLNCG